MPATASDQELIIVGSRLQALSLSTIAVALLITQRDELLPWALPLAAVLGAWALTISFRRAVLGAQGVWLRRIHSTIQAQTGEFSAYADHRYLLLRFGSGKRARIEVPVEIRPQVRTWAEANQPDGLID